MHGGHQLAQKSRRTTLPLILSRSTTRPSAAVNLICIGLPCKSNRLANMRAISFNSSGALLSRTAPMSARAWSASAICVRIWSICIIKPNISGRSGNSLLKAIIPSCNLSKNAGLPSGPLFIAARWIERQRSDNRSSGSPCLSFRRTSSSSLNCATCLTLPSCTATRRISISFLRASSALGWSGYRV